MCPEAQGYKFFRGFNSPGVLDQLNGNTVVEVAADCDNRASACRGFNSTGTLKQEIVPFVDWVPTFSVVCVGLFVPESFEIDCELDGYTFFPNMDSPGNDIHSTTELREYTIRQLSQECDNDSTCEGFNSLGFLKSLVLQESLFSKFFVSTTT